MNYANNEENTIEMSDKFRDAGNQKFIEKKYFSAIAQYNKALIAARNDNVRTALCYANRANAYVKLEYFEHCLHNINLAGKHYPLEKVKNLNGSLDNCLELMKTSVDKTMQPFVHTFKLSYEPNPKMPFFIDTLELNLISRFGKSLITKKSLRAGDVIARIDDSFRTPINDSVDYLLGCYNCLNVNNGDLIPGECGAFFCSSKCMFEHQKSDTDHLIFHEIENLKYVLNEGGRKIEFEPVLKLKLLTIGRMFMKIYNGFGNIDHMMNYVKSYGNKKCNIFDFDWNIRVDDPMYTKMMLLSIMGLISKIPDPRDEEQGKMLCECYRRFLKPGNRLREIIMMVRTRKELEFVELVLKQMHIANSILNGVSLGSEDNSQLLAVFFHPAISLAGFSCDPNVFMHYENRQSIVWTVNQPIPAGGQICVNYSSLYYHGRLNPCRYTNICFPCQNGWATLINYSRCISECNERFFNFHEQQYPTEVSSLLKQKEQCCEVINVSFNNYYWNPEKRQFIASIKEELRRILNMIGNPFSPANIVLSRDVIDDPRKLQNVLNFLKI